MSDYPADYEVTRLLTQVAELTAQLAQPHAHLEAQRRATYQAVKREHAAGREAERLQATLDALDEEAQP